MYNFAYHHPASLADAAAAIGAAPDGKLVAGGQTLIPTLKQRLAQPSDLIDLSKIPELKGITTDGTSVTIGAMTTHRAVAASEDVKRVIPALAVLAGWIGDPAVRNVGTLGGSIANADPAADYPAAVVALRATVKTDRRTISGDDFFTGLFSTALEEGEIITAVTFQAAERAAYQKFRNPASRYAMVGVFVAQAAGAVRVAVTGAGPSVFRVPEMEAALGRDFSPEAIAGITVPPDDLNSDIHGSAEYRAHLVGVMARRAVAAALAK